MKQLFNMTFLLNHSLVEAKEDINIKPKKGPEVVRKN